MAREDAVGGPTDPDAGSATLVCDRDGDASTCTDSVISRGTDGVNLLCVSFSGDPTRRLDALDELGVPLARTGVVTVGGDPVGARDPDLAYSVERIRDVDHLSELGTHVREVLREWASGSDPSALCFDSVTALLDRADLELTFEFLLVLIEGIRPTGAISHFHYDPTAHEGASARTLVQLFDRVIEVEARS